jgi:mannose-6-phosphate isomerase-like protein (cupin superfamily)
MTLALPVVHHPDESDEYPTDELCHILETWNRNDDTAVSVARARVEPGTTTRLHRLHGIAERYLILEGTGRVEVGSLAPGLVARGDMVYIPPGCPQRITNTGDTDLVFLAVCTPRFIPEAYEDIEPSP